MSGKSKETQFEFYRTAKKEIYSKLTLDWVSKHIVPKAHTSFHFLRDECACVANDNARMNAFCPISSIIFFYFWLLTKKRLNTKFIKQNTAYICQQHQNYIVLV